MPALAILFVSFQVASGGLFLTPGNIGVLLHQIALNLVLAAGMTIVVLAGGIGSIWGTGLGALLIVTLSNGLILIGVSDVWQQVVKGIVIIAAVTLDRLHGPGETDR